jgi:hypothetical protein
MRAAAACWGPQSASLPRTLLTKFDGFDRCLDRDLQLLQAAAHNYFGVPVALPLVIEFHTHRFVGLGIGGAGLEFAAWFWLGVEQRLIR